MIVLGENPARLPTWPSKNIIVVQRSPCAICEKPLVLNPWNIDGLEEIETETGAMVYNILQLRLHPSLIELKRQVDAQKTDKKYEIDLTYITSRGNWYFRSWKGNAEKAGGILQQISEFIVMMC